MNSNRSKAPAVAMLAVLTAGLSGCGGGSGSTSIVPAPTGPTDQQRAQAATTTANTNASCTAIQPFYWEIGDRSTMLAGGTASSSGATSPMATTPMLIASASKWIFGAYVVQLRNGNLTTDEINALTMRSGYTNFSYTACKVLNVALPTTTVNACLHVNNLTGNNADFDASAVGKFYYNGGHFQALADGDLQLGAKDDTTLQTAIAAQVGMDFSFSYDSPQLAAGVQTTAQDYGFFLRKILSDQLLIHDYLGADAVCTNPMTCSDALYAPIPTTENWHYSLGHWVEDDSIVGDGAFSSPGAFGFYPWIDASKTYYGILARQASVSITGNDPVAVQSVLCGRTIRKAWLTATAQ